MNLDESVGQYCISQYKDKSVVCSYYKPLLYIYNPIKLCSFVGCII